MPGMAFPGGHQHVAEGLDLAVEVVDRLVAGRAVGEHHLDRHPPVAGELPGPVDLSHSPFTDLLLDQVVGAGLRKLPATVLAPLAEQGRLGRKRAVSIPQS